MTSRRFWLGGLLVLLLGVLGVSAVGAQGGTILTIAVPDNVANTLENGIIDQFTAANPGVTINVVRTGGGRFGGINPGANAGSTLDTVLTNVTEADVLLVNAADLTPETTRAGYYLNLSPLISVDANMNPSDFYPAVWQSYQWDSGMWALPVAADVIGLLYDPAAFDEAGLPYPQESWTLYDLDQAARALATYDQNGDIITAPILDLNNYMRFVLMGMTGQVVYDMNSFPSGPALQNPQIADLMTIWALLESDGLLAGLAGGINFDSPLILAPSVLANIGQIAGDRVFIGLPGGHSGLDVSAFAVSAGTQNPELAYNFAKFLTNQRNVASAATGVIPARLSLANVTVTNNNPGGGPGGGGPGGGGPGGGGGFFNNSPEQVAQFAPYLNSALPVSEMRFSEQIGAAVGLMVSDNLDAMSALQQVEQNVVVNLQTADARFGQTALAVQESQAEAPLAPGEISISFGVGSQFGPGQAQANRNLWDNVIAQFVASDPQVGRVELDFPDGGGGGGNISNMASNYDCFYLPSNAVQGADLSTILSLDPLMSSDPTFNPNDLVGNVLSQVQLNNQTWAMPLNIQPEILLYNADTFQNTGAPLPYPGWTVSDFENDLRTIRYDPNAAAPFAPSGIGNTYLLVLLAAYGGEPIDYSTTPPTINFTDPAAVAAAQQVLDLARAGYIDYQQLAGVFGARGLRFGFGSDEDVAIYNQLLNSFLFDNAQNANAYSLASFPSGTQMNGVAYDIGTAYISATAQDPAACYRFISTLAQSPGLFPSAMPARRSQLSNPDVINTQGSDAVAFYRSIDNVMSQPNTVLVPTGFSGGIQAIGQFLSAEWLNQAFDNYVFNDADLAQGMADAQVKAQAFQNCVDSLPAPDPSQGNQGFFQQITNCAQLADPELSLFGNN